MARLLLALTRVRGRVTYSSKICAWFPLSLAWLSFILDFAHVNVYGQATTSYFIQEQLAFFGN